MKMLVHRAGPFCDDEIGSVVLMELPEAARAYTASPRQAVPVKKEDIEMLVKQREKDPKPLGRHEAHRLPIPDHGKACRCRACELPVKQ